MIERMCPGDRPSYVYCPSCGHDWIAIYLPMEARKAARVLKGATYCQKCGRAGTRMGRNPNAAIGLNLFMGAGMITDEGLRFRATLRNAEGVTHTRETDNRVEFLEWIATHRRAGDTVIEVGLLASDPAVENMLRAVSAGASRMTMANTGGHRRNGDQERG